MHDFGVSSTHTIIMDLPLSLDPLNLAKNKPVVAYDPTGRSRFGVFPRYHSDRVRWFETNPCCIFHTANTWDTTATVPTSGPQAVTAINMLACRLTSAALVFSAGDLAAPVPIYPIPADQHEEEQCRLYYYQFDLSDPSNNTIAHQYSLSAIPFEFPSLSPYISMSAATYIYGCSVSEASFGAALGRAVKINSLVKMDVLSLIAKGKYDPPTAITGCVDTRSVADVLVANDPADPIKIFKMPEGWYAQESRFVPRENGVSEDDGWLVFYVFDEHQLAEDGECCPDTKSELWILDAKNMKDVVAKVKLPQRVPYGLHGSWFSEDEVKGQRPVESVRTLPIVKGKQQNSSQGWKIWMGMRRSIERWLA